VNDDCLKLTVYFGESDRVGGHLLSNRLLEVYERHRTKASLLLRAVEGFGLKHKLHTQRLLTLSEDLPLVSIAVDSRERIEGMLDEVVGLVGDGLVTLERARLLTGEIGGPLPAALPHEQTKLTVYLGRQERVGRRPAYLHVVDLLRRHRVAGASVLLGVDGVVHGSRERARFFARNAEVPLLVVAVGDVSAVAPALDELDGSLADPLLTLERVRVLKRDGRLFAPPPRVADADEHGLAIWQKLTVYAGEQSRHGGHPLYIELVRRLRRAEASGATALRGIWGYSGEHAPHGDTFWSIRRRVPVLALLVDAPEEVQRLWPIVDELTDETGLVTSELVPALQAAGGGARSGGLRLASRLHRP